jgi:hypothetical protein
MSCPAEVLSTNLYLSKLIVPPDIHVALVPFHVDHPVFVDGVNAEAGKIWRVVKYTARPLVSVYVNSAQRLLVSIPDRVSFSRYSRVIVLAPLASELIFDMRGLE